MSSPEGPVPPQENEPIDPTPAGPTAPPAAARAGRVARLLLALAYGPVLLGLWVWGTFALLYADGPGWVRLPLAAAVALGLVWNGRLV